jgi:hypothetical protein
MPPIAKIGSLVEVTPLDEIQIVFGPGNHEFVNDKTPFSMKVDGLLKEKERVIGVYGPVVSGHERYKDLTATLLVRLDNSDWTRDNHSAAGFKVGQGPAKPNGKYLVSHPEGTDIDGFPFIVRYGSIDSRARNEQIVNSAKAG